MGIVNVTPDSFSDGGAFAASSATADFRHAAIERALKLVADGADIIDIGGESTRPYADAVTVGEELHRVLAVVEALSKRIDLPISIDTSKEIVAEAAIVAGAEIVNDVTGLAGDPAMLHLVRDSGVGVCAMHMQGTPQTMQDDPQYGDVVEEIHAWLAERRDALVGAGIAAERLCLDPGIGFGKTHEHNLTLMQNLGRFLDLGCPVLVGHSRKGFLGKIVGDKEADRDAATAGAAIAAAVAGVQILRVHNVRLVREVLLGFEACSATMP